MAGQCYKPSDLLYEHIYILCPLDRHLRRKETRNMIKRTSQSSSPSVERRNALGQHKQKLITEVGLFLSVILQAVSSSFPFHSAISYAVNIFASNEQNFNFHLRSGSFINSQHYTTLGQERPLVDFFSVFILRRKYNVRSQ